MTDGKFYACCALVFILSLGVFGAMLDSMSPESRAARAIAAKADAAKAIERAADDAAWQKAEEDMHWTKKDREEAAARQWEAAHHCDLIAIGRKPIPKDCYE